MQNGELHWRETYYVFFQSSQRPKLQAIQAALAQLSERIIVRNAESDDDDRFESVLIDAPDDHAALEISYEGGEGVVEQSVELAKQFKEDLEPNQLAELMRADARFDVMHFEHVHESEDDFDEDDMEEMLDPGCLLLVVNAMADITNGVAIDPASGALLL